MTLTDLDKIEKKCVFYRVNYGGGWQWHIEWLQDDVWQRAEAATLEECVKRMEGNDATLG